MKDWGHGAVPGKDLGYTEHQTPALSVCMASELWLGWGQHNCGGHQPSLTPFYRMVLGQGPGGAVPGQR